MVPFQELAGDEFQLALNFFGTPLTNMDDIGFPFTPTVELTDGFPSFLSFLAVHDEGPGPTDLSPLGLESIEINTPLTLSPTNGLLGGEFSAINAAVGVVPEPSSLLAFGMGCGLCVMTRRRRKRT